MIHQFAEKYNVKVKRDDCQDNVVGGIRGNIYDGFADGSLGLYVRFETVRKYTSVRKKLESAGFTVKQNAATEGCFKFKPENAQQARMALKLVGARARREPKPPTEAQLAARAAFASRRRSQEVVFAG